MESSPLPFISPPPWRRRWHRRLFSVAILIFLLHLGSAAGGVELTMATHLFDIQKDFNQPSDVAVAEDGTIYVVDGINGMIKAFHHDGTFKFSTGRAGAGQGEFALPLGIDTDQSGRIFVADSQNQRIQILSQEGKYLSEIKVPDGTLKKADPTDVAVSSSGNRCFVADNDNHCILEFDVASKTLLNRYGKPGSEKWEFRYPFLMHLHQDKDLYIVDVINTRVQVVSTEGKFVNIVGGWGVEKGQFFRPKGVTVDSRGRSYVSDSYMGVIQLFDVTGHFHSVIGDPETGKVKKFTTPMGISVDRSNRLYVVEMLPGRVGVYQLSSVVP